MHRDLKPENILLQKIHNDLIVKISDFGCAKKFAAGANTVVGTKEYMAPELLMNFVSKISYMNYGFESDIWSLGVLFY